MYKNDILYLILLVNVFVFILNSQTEVVFKDKLCKKKIYEEISSYIKIVRTKLEVVYKLDAYFRRIHRYVLAMTNLLDYS